MTAADDTYGLKIHRHELCVWFIHGRLAGFAVVVMVLAIGIVMMREAFRLVY